MLGAVDVRPGDAVVSAVELAELQPETEVVVVEGPPGAAPIIGAALAALGYPDQQALSVLGGQIAVTEEGWSHERRIAAMAARLRSPQGPVGDLVPPATGVIVVGGRTGLDDRVPKDLLVASELGQLTEGQPGEPLARSFADELQTVLWRGEDPTGVLRAWADATVDRRGYDARLDNIACDAPFGLLVDPPTTRHEVPAQPRALWYLARQLCAAAVPLPWGIGATVDESAVRLAGCLGDAVGRPELHAWRAAEAALLADVAGGEAGEHHEALVRHGSWHTWDFAAAAGETERAELLARLSSAESGRTRDVARSAHQLRLLEGMALSFKREAERRRRVESRFLGGARAVALAQRVLPQRYYVWLRNRLFHR